MRQIRSQANYRTHRGWNGVSKRNCSTPPNLGVPFGRRFRNRVVPLSRISERCQTVIERLTETLEENLEWMLYLREHGLDPGRTVSVVDTAPDGTLTLELAGATVALGSALADNIYVSVKK
ncbi:MAG: hypothetical protein C4319_08060 [Acidimicrobiia bacterium]